MRPPILIRHVRIEVHSLIHTARPPGLQIPDHIRLVALEVRCTRPGGINPRRGGIYITQLFQHRLAASTFSKGVYGADDVVSDCLDRHTLCVETFEQCEFGAWAGGFCGECLGGCLGFFFFGRSGASGEHGRD